jgi:hypothetical protein
MKWPIATVVVLTLTGASRADVPPGLPATDWALPVHLVRAAFPPDEYVFVLLQAHEVGPAANTDAQFVTLTHEQPLRICPTWRGDRPTLFVVPAAAAARYPSAAALPDAVNRKEILGALTKTFGTERIAVPVWRSEPVVIEYAINLIDRDTPSSGVEITQLTWPRPLLQWYVAVGLLSVGVVGIGLWIARRLVSRRALSRQCSA